MINYPNAPDFAFDVLSEFGPYPINTNSCTVWRNTYLKNEITQAVKDYRLCRVDKDDDVNFYVDEGNGVQLSAQWIGNLLITPFKYDDLILISITKLDNNIFQEDIIIIDDESQKAKGVRSLKTRSIQRIQMKRINN